MKKYKNIIFDLDGTLTDSKEGIVDSLLFSFEQMGRTDYKKDYLATFIGEPLKKIYAQLLNTDDSSKIDSAVKYYRDAFIKDGIYKNRLYDGIDELLFKTKKNGCNVYLATIKPTEYAEQILKMFDIYKYFNKVFGTTMDGKHSSKKELIEIVRNENSNMPKESYLMVGDKASDIEGAIQNGIESVAVLYGYSSINEFEMINPTYKAKNVEDLKTLFKNLNITGEDE